MIRLIFLSVVFCSLAVLSGCDRFSPQKQLEQWVENEKTVKKFPHKINPNQDLIDIQTGEMEMIQIFQLRGVSEDQLEESEKTAKQQVLRQLKKKKAEIQNLIDYKVLMTFRYVNNKNEALFEFSIKPWTELE